MSLAFTFPGQGSQAVGMGQELAQTYPQAKAVFDEVDEALGLKLSKIMWDGPDDTLRLTENAQPALMAVSLAVVRVLEANNFKIAEKVSYVAGHSLGEYSALAAAGSLTISETARLLQIRGRAMQAAVPVGEGAMAALIGLDFEAVKEVAADAAQGTVCDVANDNAPGQVVVSGSKAAVERAIDIGKAKGAKMAVLLPVSAPFHCSLMAPAAEAMETALHSMTLNAPCVPLVANVLARPISDPSEISRRLVEQVTGMVRWSESVSWMANDGGVTHLMEVGTGKVLSGLARRIDRALTGKTLGTPQEIDAFLAENV